MRRKGKYWCYDRAHFRFIDEGMQLVKRYWIPWVRTNNRIYTNMYFNDPAYVLKPTDFIKFLAKGWKPLKRTDEK